MSTIEETEAQLKPIGKAAVKKFREANGMERAGDTRHTPGPWRWELNEKSKEVQLCGGKTRFDLTVMDFVRYGMGGAAPRFLTGELLLSRCEEFGQAVTGREHHADWFKTLNHPDAHLIAAAPLMLEALKAWIDQAGQCDCNVCALMTKAIKAAEGDSEDE